jgi:hypothetical protein
VLPAASLRRHRPQTTLRLREAATLPAAIEAAFG